jgi:hypothetical protein
MTRPVILFILIFACSYSQPVSVAYWGLCDTIPPGDVVTADSVFRYAESLSHIIDYDDCNICKSRAHILARALEKRFPAAKIAKLWLVAECKTSSHKDEYKYREHKLLRYSDECNNWVYHVAPVVITAKDTLVVDPATQKGTVGVYRWMHDLIRIEGTAVALLKEKRFFIYPDDADDNFEDKKADWNDSDEPVTDDDYSRAIDEVTRAKLGFIEPWKMQEHVKKLKELVK